MLKIVTFNLRCPWFGEKYDGINSFMFRAGQILDTIDNRMPDVILFQEVREKLADFLEKHIYGYRFMYAGRYEDLKGEGLGVAYRADKLELREYNIFWLSETPDVPGSRFPEQSECPRICASFFFRERETGKCFRVYNNHLDHISDNARILGITEVLKRVEADNRRFKLPTFIVGDFNAHPGEEPIEYCNNYKPFPITDLTENIECTFHDFGRARHKIDYIYCDRETAQRKYSSFIWDENQMGIYLSDHYPVETDIEL